MASKKSPDYANSIKESISAVEAISQLITGNQKATLGDALRQLENKLGGGIHPALRNAFNSLYGYTSDAQGIRHALLGKSDLDVEDAKFMLIACSAFINYLVVKYYLFRKGLGMDILNNLNVVISVIVGLISIGGSIVGGIAYLRHKVTTSQQHTIQPQSSKRNFPQAIPTSLSKLDWKDWMWVLWNGLEDCFHAKKGTGWLNAGLIGFLGDLLPFRFLY